MKEIWRDCKGYEGKYQVSNLGRIWGVKRQHYLKPTITSNGYLEVCMIAKNGKQKVELVHRLVALAFIDNPDKLPQVNHKDEDKTNNCVDNLEWTTCKQNINYGTGIERRAKQRMMPIRCIDLNKIYESMTQASKETGIPLSYISKACTGIQETAGGFRWEVIL